MRYQGETGIKSSASGVGRRTILAVGIPIAMALCACRPSSFVVPDDKPTSKVIFDFVSDSSHTTYRSIGVMALAGFDCGPSPYGALIALRQFTTAQELVGPIDVVAGEPFTFMVSYSETRLAQQRDCNFMAAFTPVAGQLYVASFRSPNEVGSCGVRIEEQSQSSLGRKNVEFSAPEYLCNGKGGDKRGNGQALHVKDKYRINTIPNPGK